MTKLNINTALKTAGMGTNLFQRVVRVVFYPLNFCVDLSQRFTPARVDALPCDATALAEVRAGVALLKRYVSSCVIIVTDTQI